jgi:hypothetical protein
VRPLNQKQLVSDNGLPLHSNKATVHPQMVYIPSFYKINQEEKFQENGTKANV